ncbi:MAG: tRNA lysidine(34) synthetase TilS, partial [Lachnospiraceae bacterium]|nr:tRNA lysidine(34) synthetase TilS [Lachnospiraceae bacterium]
MQKKIQIFMEQHHMIESGDRVVAGVSGGADSVCLLLILREMSRRMGFFLAAVHVEHGIRGEESRRDAAFTEQLCADLEVPFLLCPADVPEWARTTGQGLEEAARELRYNSFFSACEAFRADKIALAHHANDSAETMLFHLARGTGIRGMC